MPFYFKDKTTRYLFLLLISYSFHWINLSSRLVHPEYKKHIGGSFDILETYPSTEGFLAYQDRLEETGLQLALDHGIFFEFVPLDPTGNITGIRYSLHDVETGVDYALVLNTNAGLWGYIIGDVIRFITLDPYRIEIRGRLGQYISAFGEHVIVAETDLAIKRTSEKFNLSITEYTVAPCFPDGELPYHQWYIEFGIQPDNLTDFETNLQKEMEDLNFTYKKTTQRKAISPLRIRLVRKNGFYEYLKENDRTGMQQKIPHVSNNDYFISGLNAFTID